MKIYLAGPMRGYKGYNFPAFDEAARKLRAQGHEVFNPADRDRQAHPDLDWNVMTGDMATDFPAGSPFSLRAALGDDTAWICREAEAIALLPGWDKSKGAYAENALGVALGLLTILLP